MQHDSSTARALARLISALPVADRRKLSKFIMTLGSRAPVKGIPQPFDVLPDSASSEVFNAMTDALLLRMTEAAGPEVSIGFDEVLSGDIKVKEEIEDALYPPPTEEDVKYLAALQDYISTIVMSKMARSTAKGRPIGDLYDSEDLTGWGGALARYGGKALGYAVPYLKQGGSYVARNARKLWNWTTGAAPKVVQGGKKALQYARQNPLNVALAGYSIYDISKQFSNPDKMDNSKFMSIVDAAKRVLSEFPTITANDVILGVSEALGKDDMATKEFESALLSRGFSTTGPLVRSPDALFAGEISPVVKRVASMVVNNGIQNAANAFMAYVGAVSEDQAATTQAVNPIISAVPPPSQGLPMGPPSPFVPGATTIGPESRGFVSSGAPTFIVRLSGDGIGTEIPGDMRYLLNDGRVFQQMVRDAEAVVSRPSSFTGDFSSAEPLVQACEKYVASNPDVFERVAAMYEKKGALTGEMFGDMDDSENHYDFHQVKNALSFDGDEHTGDFMFTGDTPYTGFIALGALVSKGVGLLGKALGGKAIKSLGKKLFSKKAGKKLFGGVKRWIKKKGGLKKIGFNLLKKVNPAIGIIDKLRKAKAAGKAGASPLAIGKQLLAGFGSSRGLGPTGMMGLVTKALKKKGGSKGGLLSSILGQDGANLSNIIKANTPPGPTPASASQLVGLQRQIQNMQSSLQRLSMSTPSVMGMTSTAHPAALIGGAGEGDERWANAALSNVIPGRAQFTPFHGDTPGWVMDGNFIGDYALYRPASYIEADGDIDFDGEDEVHVDEAFDSAT